MSHGKYLAREGPGSRLEEAYTHGGQRCRLIFSGTGKTSTVPTMNENKVLVKANLWVPNKNAVLFVVASQRTDKVTPKLKLPLKNKINHPKINSNIDKGITNHF